jgi:uncharacterized protein (DUF427 family)
MKRISIPGAEHPITVEPTPMRVRVLLHAKVLADTRRALVLREAGLAPVQYIPREDADMSLLEQTGHRTYCPYKGDCSYFSIRIGEHMAENAVWCYESPYPAVAAIARHLAFYPNRVDAIEET